MRDKRELMRVQALFRRLWFLDFMTSALFIPEGVTFFTTSILDEKRLVVHA